MKIPLRIPLQLLFAAISVWITINYLHIPEPSADVRPVLVQATRMELTSDAVNWRAAAGESSDKKWLRQTQLIVFGSDGARYSLACRHIESLCKAINSGPIASITFSMLPGPVDGHSWAMTASKGTLVLVGNREQRERLLALKRERLFMLLTSYLLTIAVVLGARVWK